MEWKGITGLLLAVALVLSAGCTSGPAVNRSEITFTDTPTLPDKYSAQTAAEPEITTMPTITVNATPPILEASALSTINGTGLTGNITNVTPTSSSGSIVPAAAFTSTVTAGFAPFTVYFTDNSQNQPTSWFWDFGDGGASDLQNPVYTYTQGGRFNVNFGATNDAGTGWSNLTTYISVYSPGFYAVPTTIGRGSAVLFFDTGSGYPLPSTGFWDFGDGITTKTGPVQNVTHQYTLPGVYNVSHSVSGSSGTAWVNKSAYIIVT